MLQHKLCVVPASSSLKNRVLTAYNCICICADVSHCKGRTYIYLSVARVCLHVCMYLSQTGLTQQLAFVQGQKTEVLWVAHFQYQVFQPVMVNDTPALHFFLT